MTLTADPILAAVAALPASAVSIEPEGEMLERWRRVVGVADMLRLNESRALVGGPSRVK